MDGQRRLQLILPLHLVLCRSGAEVAANKGLLPNALCWRYPGNCGHCTFLWPHRYCPWLATPYNELLVICGNESPEDLLFWSVLLVGLVLWVVMYPRNSHFTLRRPSYFLLAISSDVRLSKLGSWLKTCSWHDSHYDDEHHVWVNIWLYMELTQWAGYRHVHHFSVLSTIFVLCTVVLLSLHLLLWITLGSNFGALLSNTIAHGVFI